MSQTTLLASKALNCLQSGQLEQASAHYKALLKLDPKHAEANHLLGIIYHQQGDSSKAERLIRKAIKFAPQYWAAHNNLGVVLTAMKKPSQARSVLAKLVKQKPDYADAHCNLGVVQLQLGEGQQGQHSLEQALQLKPQHADALNALGLLFQERFQLEPAITYFQRACQAAPKHVDALYNLGVCLAESDNHDLAIEAFSQVLTQQPQHAEALNKQGSALQKQGLLSAAGQAFEAALALDPDNAQYQFSQAWNHHHKRDYQLAAEGYQAVLKKQADHPSAFTSLLMLSNYSEAFSRQQVFELHHRWGDKAIQLAGKSRNESRNESRNKPQQSKSEKAHHPGIRIGYISADFCRHSVAYFFLPLIRQHDKTQFDIYCYYTGLADDEITHEIQSQAQHWRSVFSLSDKALCQQIRDDEIDILVDLAGHTQGNRLMAMAQKPAPIQISWCGYPNTTGLEAIDYRLVDRYTDPLPEAQAFYSETLLQLPNGFLCYQAPASAPEVATAPCNSNGQLTFGSFNNLTKVTHEVLQTWAAILTAVPESRLLLKSRQLIDPETQARVLDVFKAAGIATSRIETLARIDDPDGHLAMYHHVDIALDTFPYNGTTTTFEALWMGVPTLTLCGDRHSARVGYSINSQLGLDDYIANSIEDYIATAQGLADNKSRLNALRISLRQRLANSNLCDAQAFAQDIESTYRQLLGSQTQE